jgi:hypothetical protein
MAFKLREARYMKGIPIVIIINENEATVVFRRQKGVIDYMGLFGTDAVSKYSN